MVQENFLYAETVARILVKSLETPQINYLYDYQLLPFAPNSNAIAQTVDDAFRSLGINKNSSVLCCLMLHNIW